MDRATAVERLRSLPEYIPGPCPWCGATTDDQASELCRPTVGMDGDYRCGTPEESPDTNGLLHQRNPEYDRLDGYLWGWYAVDQGYTTVPPEWDNDNSEETA